MRIQEDHQEREGGKGHATLRPAEGLLQLLGAAKVLEEKAGAFEGHPARRLRLALLNVDLDEDSRRYVKQADHEATVWIGPDGLPPAMALRSEIKVKVLFFGSAWTKVHIQRRFQRTQNRLLLLDEQADAQGRGLGTSVHTHETTRCNLVL